MNQMELDRMLIFFSKLGRLSSMQELCLMGANVKAFHSESLQAAAENGHLEAVKFLIQRGADVHARNGAAFRSAYHNQKKEIRDYLFMVMKKGSN